MTLPTPPKPTRYGNYGAALLRWLSRNEFRRLNALIRAGKSATIDTEHLASQFEILLLENAVISDYLARSTRYSLTPGDARRLARRGAVWVVEHYDPHHLERCRRGGLRSRRGAIYTVGDLRGLRGSKRAQAEALGCSTSTIANLRRELAKRVRALAAKRPHAAHAMIRELLIQNDDTHQCKAGKRRYRFVSLELLRSARRKSAALQALLR